MCYRKQIRCTCNSRQSSGGIRDAYVQKDIYTRMSFFFPFTSKKAHCFHVLADSFHKIFSQVVSEFFRMKLLPIANVAMDQCQCSTQRLGTTGVGPCMCFIVILDEGEYVYIEHRSGLGLPREFTAMHATQYLKRIAKQIHSMRPTSNIM
jgi:hypothetical protein